MTVTISPEVLAVLDAATVTGNRLELTGQLDRKLYEQTNKILTLLGGKWNRAAKAHLFPGDAADVVTAAILAGEVVDTKRDFDAFFTPPDLACEVVRRADVQPGTTVLEPSAGEGALALAAHAAGGKVFCIEAQERHVQTLRGHGFEAWWGDFLTRGVSAQLFDRVVMNPPFSKQRDIVHVLHAHAFLRPGGRLVSIMSASVLFRTNALTQRFREHVAAHNGTIEPLASGSFREAGTMVNTVLVCMDGAGGVP